MKLVPGASGEIVNRLEKTFEPYHETVNRLEKAC
jgi:N-formylglutamate amidohydrolase